TLDLPRGTENRTEMRAQRIHRAAQRRGIRRLDHDADVRDRWVGDRTDDHRKLTFQPRENVLLKVEPERALELLQGGRYLRQAGDLLPVRRRRLQPESPVQGLQHVRDEVAKIEEADRTK